MKLTKAQLEALTDKEIIELEQLLKLQAIDNKRLSLLKISEHPKNYRYLHECRDVGMKGVILEGSARCFDGSQFVITKQGRKKISDIVSDDEVLTLNEQSKEREYKPVETLLSFLNRKRCVNIKLKNGNTIKCSEDHHFYHEGAWVEVKHLLSLWDKNKI